MACPRIHPALLFWPFGVVVAATTAAATAITSTEKGVPQWASRNALQLTLSAQPGLQFTTIPLTEHLGLNRSDRSRKVVRIYGDMVPANLSNFKHINGPEDVAYLCCDKPDSGPDASISPDMMLNELMKQQPKAIVLYSINQNWCSISNDRPLSYTSILTMADAGEAANVLSHLNSTLDGGKVNVLISGNASENVFSSGPRSYGSNNSAVAMSILYSITGLITLLFLIIIATGAVRAHRYPERYGPRGASNGRSRQSRAKGLARAVLDTLPIVKFGNQSPSKSDPELELETGATQGQSNSPMHMTASGSRAADDPSDEAAATSIAAATARRGSHGSLPTTTADRHDTSTDGEEAASGHVECSICTEDFKVGEDVRVLPCGHQFHPNCVDHWLINVSGTCPLCRLDLRPEQASPHKTGSGGEDDIPLAPPLTLEGEDGQLPPGPHGNRVSRFFDVSRLRQASLEERIEALRQMRAHANEADARAEPGMERAHGAGLTDKLKEKFRILTRAQTAQGGHE